MTTSNFNPSIFTSNFSGSMNSNGTSQTTTGVYTTQQSSPRSISITPVANGYSVSIGCQTFVFESIINMLPEKFDVKIEGLKFDVVML